MGRTLRIGLLIYGSLDTFSGGYLYDRKLVEHLRSKGGRVELISLPWRNYARHLGDNFSQKLSRQLLTLPLDVLIQDELNHPSLFWLNRHLRPQINYPVISIVHHLRSSERWPAWQKSFYCWVERVYLSSVDGFIFNSQTTRKVVLNLLEKGIQSPLGSRSEVRKHRPVSQPNIVAYPGGDRLPGNFSEREIAVRAHNQNPLRLVFLGNVIPRKGLHTLLKALRHLPEGTWELRIIGGLRIAENYVKEIKQRVTQAGWGSKVNFLGPLNDEALSRQLRACHVMVIPSDYEGFGIAYLEGMRFGLPAIATTTGAAHEIITHSQDGFLIEPNDDSILAQHLSTLQEAREQLLAMSIAARQRYISHQTWEISMDKVRLFLESLL